MRLVDEEVEGGVDGVSSLDVDICVNAQVSVPNTKLLVDIPGFRLRADLVFKLNVESSLLVNGILVAVIACGSLRINSCSACL